MSRILLLTASEDLVTGARKCLLAQGRDYTGNLVLFQGKRPAHFLRRELAGAAAGSIIPPRVESIGMFVDRMSVELGGVAGPDLGPLDAVGLIADLHSKGVLFPGGERAGGLDVLLPVGLELFEALEELKLGLVPPSRFKLVGGPLAALYELFYSAVEAMGRSTRAMRYAMVADRLTASQLRSFSAVVVAGFFGLTASENRIFRVLASLDQTTFIFQDGPGIRERIEALGLVCPPPRETDHRPVVHLYNAADVHEETFAAAGLVQALLGSGEKLAEETVLVLPSTDALFPVFQWILPLLGDRPSNISLGYPIERTPVFGFVDSLLRVVSSADDGRVPAIEYLHFLLHPYTKNIRWKGRADVTRILIHAVEERCARRRTERFLSIAELEGDADLRHSICRRVAGAGFEVSPREVEDHFRSIHDATIRAIPGCSTVAECASRIRQVLRFIREESTALLHPMFARFADAADESLEGLARSMLGERSLDTVGAYAAIIRAVLSTASAAFPGTPLHGLQILGFLETRNLRFDRVIALDVNEGILPAADLPDPFLPPSVRMQLGLPATSDRIALARHSFELLVRGAREVHCFFTERHGGLRSRFIEQLLWEEQQRKQSAGENTLIHSVRRHVRLTQDPPGPIPKPDRFHEVVAGSPLSPTALDTYLRCQLRFYYAHVLRLRERATIAEEVDPMEIGRLVHRVLAEWAKPMVGREMTTADMDTAAFRAVFERSFLSSYGEDPSPDLLLMKGQTLAHLELALHEYFVPVATGNTLLGVEVPLAAEFGGRKLTGFADRIERRGGKVFILDFKTGSDPARYGVDFDLLIPGERESWGRAVGSVQLLLYRFLYGAMNAWPADDIIPAYVMLGRERIDPTVEARMFDDAEGAGDHSLKAQYLLTALLDEIHDNHIPFSPPPNLHETCPDCPYSGICGTGWVRSWNADR